MHALDLRVRLTGEEREDVGGDLAFLRLATLVQLVQRPAKASRGRLSSGANQTGVFLPSTRSYSLNEVNGTRQRLSGPSQQHGIVLRAAQRSPVGRFRRDEQTAAYENTNIPLGMLLALDLTKKQSVGQHISTLYRAAVGDFLDDGVRRGVLVVKIPGNRISPAVATQRGRKRHEGGSTQPGKPARRKPSAKKSA